MILSFLEGFVSATSNLTTFLGVKNWPCPPRKDGDMKISKASAITSRSLSIKQYCCNSPTIYAMELSVKLILSLLSKTSGYLLFTEQNNFFIRDAMSLLGSSIPARKLTMSFARVKRSSYILQNIILIIWTTNSLSSVMPVLFAAK